MSTISKALERSKRERGELAQEREAPPPPVMPRRPAPRVGVDLPGVSPAVEEEYNALASEIYLALPEVDSRVVMFASAISGEGTSLIAWEFAYNLATNNECETLLIDGNLRRPILHEKLRAHREPGLADHVLAGVPIPECMRDVRVPHLSFMPAGRSALAPQRVFADRRMDELLAKLRLRFSYVVLDVSPILSFSEGIQFSRKVDGVVLVVHSGHTKRELVRRAAELLDDAGAKVLGTVLNRRKFYIPKFIYERL